MQDITLVRNIALFGHGKSGKTSLAEALLYSAGKTTRLGKVDDGSSVMDFEPESKRMRVISVNPGFSFDDVQKTAGLSSYDQKISKKLPPTDQELDVLRYEVDPYR